MNSPKINFKKASKSIAVSLAVTGLLLSNVSLVSARTITDKETENNRNAIAQMRREPLEGTRRSQKPRIAVLNFDYSSVNSPYVYDFMRARGVSDILVNRLVRTGKYRVIERSQIDAILKEQNLGASGRVDAATAAQIGKLLGVKQMIIGSVTQFNVDKSSDGVSVFGFGGSTEKAEATVQLNVRVIDTDTAEILAVAEARENSTSEDDSVSAFGVSTSSSSSNEGKLLSSATVKALEDIVNQLNSQL